MSKLGPNDYMMVADVLEAMYEADIPWPDDVYVMSDKVELRYRIGDDA